MTTEDDRGCLGAMRDAAEELDEIVQEAMRRREISAWLPRAPDFEILEWVCSQSGRSLYDLLDEALDTWLQPWRGKHDESRRLAAGDSDGADREPI